MVAEYGSSFELIETLGEGISLQDTNNVLYVRTAREALLYLCNQSYLKTVFMPALCCASMVQPFIQAGIKVCYYNVNSDLTIDLYDLGKKLRNNSFLLVMHYFGIRSYQQNELKQLLNQFSNMIVIQDCTQHIFSLELYDEIADFWIGSIRKWVPIADGAFVASQRHSIVKDTSIIDEDDGFVEKTFTAMQNKQLYLRSGNVSVKECYRRAFNECMMQLKKDIKIHQMSDLSRELFHKHVNCTETINRRNENYERLCSILGDAFPKETKYKHTPHSPLCFIMIIDRRNDVQKKLAEIGIYCQVLWPISEEAGSVSAFSKWFSEHMLAIPCDQRYTLFDMETIASHIRDILREGA